MKKKMQENAASRGFTLDGYDGASSTQYIKPDMRYSSAVNGHRLAFLIASFPKFNFILNS